MSAQVINWPVGSHEIECYKCHCRFAISNDWDNELRRTHGTFYCPNGHGQMYTGESQEEKLKRQLEYTTQQRDAARDARDKAQKNEETLRHRIKKGRCPASKKCKARFHDVAEHVKKAHKRYPW